MTLPIPPTYMPNDQLLHGDLNSFNGLKGQQNALFNMPRAKLVFTGSGSNTSGVQPIAATFGAGLGATQYDHSFDGSALVDGSRRGFQIQIPGLYRVQARWSWVDSASAASGLRFLGLYKQFNVFTSAGANIGSPLVGAASAPDAFDWDIGRRVPNNPCTARIDITESFIRGTTLQLGVCQNSGVSLSWVAGIERCWFSIHMESGGG